jgi:imidazolonepropionase-like amidohydrolase
MRANKAIFFALAILCLPSAGKSQQQATLFKDIRVFDGLNVMPKTNVLVEGEKITKMGKDFSVPMGADTILGDDMTLMPGLIDGHCHVSGRALEDAIMAGVTTELDMFTTPLYAANIRKEQEAGKMLDRADLYSAGFLVTAPGGHGTEYGMPIPTLSSADSAQAFVDDRLAEGSDYIKIVYDNGKIFGMKTPTLSKETLKAVIEATHKRGRLAVAHIGSVEDARDAIECGVDGLMHAPSDVMPDAEFFKLARKHKIFVCPTLSVINAATGGSNISITQDTNVMQYATRANIANIEKPFPKRDGTIASFSIASQITKQFKLAHVLVLAGTDAPNPGTAHGFGLHHELELIAQSGLVLKNVLASATSNPADAFRLRDRGRIAPNYRADLLLVNGDPTTDIKATRNIVAVWKRGHKVDRSAYLAKCAEQREATGMK